MATNAYYLNQYISTTLAVAGGITDSATSGIIIASTTNIDTTKPGIACLTYTDPIDTSKAEWITYTSIDSGTKELQGVTRGQEGYSAKAHDNGATVAFPLSESHINNLNTALMIGGSATNLAEGVLDEDDMASNSATKLATQQSIKAYVDSSDSTDGWIASTDTWTYASATSFTISGSDETAVFTTGTRIKLTNDGSTKYFIVVSSSFSTNTTVNITGGTDYTLANSAITNPYYSYEVNPQGYPGWFDYDGTPASGFSANPTVAVSRFCVNGRLCTVHHSETADGTSNAGGFTIPAPITGATQAGATWSAAASVKDNGTLQSVPGLFTMSSGSSTLSVNKDFAASSFTASGNKRLYWGVISYEI